jgi:protein-tyrosine-phosphatase
MGIDMPRHSSTPLSREMLADADVVFTLTQGHRQNVIALDPEAERRVFVLDPGGQDVPDPIGQPQDAYDRTARRIQELVDQRLTELNW